MACCMYGYNRDAQMQATVNSSCRHKAFVLYMIRAKRDQAPLCLSLSSLWGRPGPSLPLSVLLLSGADQAPRCLYLSLLLSGCNPCRVQDPKAHIGNPRFSISDATVCRHQVPSLPFITLIFSSLPLYIEGLLCLSEDVSL